MTDKVLCTTLVDVRSCVCINGIQFPAGDAAYVDVVLTDKFEKTFDNPWVDLRTTDLQIWATSCGSKKVYNFTEKDIGDWSVEIIGSKTENKLYLVKSKS